MEREFPSRARGTREGGYQQLAVRLGAALTPLRSGPAFTVRGEIGFGGQLPA